MPQRASCTMQLDLTFTDAHMELEFAKLQAAHSRQLGKQFHLNRAAIWGIMLLRVLSCREWATAAAIVLVLLLPACTHSLPLPQYTRLYTPIKILDNLLQLCVGCCAHSCVYPNPKQGEPSTFQMTAVLLTGNGVPWQLFNSIWGSLSFRFALPQQAALTVLLLLYNRSLCSKNIPLRHAYVALWGRLVDGPRVALSRLSALRVAHRLWELYYAGRNCTASVLAAPLEAREAVRAACMAAQEAAAAAGSGAGVRHAPSIAAAAAAMGGDGVGLCMRCQPISQLLLGFLLPTFWIWCSELRQRRAFLQAQNARQRWEPTWVEYLMFAVPAVAAMYTMVAVHA